MTEHVAAIGNAMVALTATLIASLVLQCVVSVAVIFCILYQGRPQVAVLINTPDEDEDDEDMPSF